jgi:hypothetical protein
MRPKDSGLLCVSADRAYGCLSPRYCAAMSRPRYGKASASFPPDHPVGPLFRFVFFLATISRRVRAFFFKLPRSRFRTYWVATYYRVLLQRLGEGNFGFLPAVHEGAELTMFGMETYQGRAAWRQALTSWLESIELGLETSEYIDPGRGEVMLGMRLTGRGSSSGLAVDDFAYLVIRVDDGKAARGHFYREKEEALAAVGLRM